MKILIVAEKDAANISLGRIANKYLELGHEVVVYAIYYEANVLRYFNFQIPRYSISALSGSDIDTCDFIFASAVSLNGIIKCKLLSVHKPIFTQRYMTDGALNWGGDFCFLPSLKTTTAEYDENLVYSKLEIGEPKYDVNALTTEVKNRLLFIDSGHYPFGEDGKRNLAQTLLKICDTYKDYELWIKPRFLPNDKIITHQNTRHLYDVIAEEANNHLPKNLVMLKQHRDLKELIDSSHTVISMFTSAFVGAYVSDKGLIVLDNLPSEDVYDVRWKLFNHTRNCLKSSGALIDYRKVDSLLPHGAQCPEGYLKELLAEQKDVAAKICEVTEFLCHEFYSKEIFPCRIECSYQDFYQQVNVDESMTWEKIVKDRYLNCLAFKSLTMISFNINALLDVSIIQKHLHCLKNSLMTEEKFAEELKKTRDYRQKCIAFNEKKMMEDDIDSGILLNALYQLRRTEEIKKFSKKNIGAYHLFRGFVAYDENEKEVAISELKQYMDITLNRVFIKEISDISNHRMWAFCILIEILSKQEERQYYLLEMKKYYDTLYLWMNGIVDRAQAQHYAYMKWSENRVQGYRVPPHYPIDENVIVYGAGVLSRKLLLGEERIRNTIKAFIDVNLNQTNLEGISIIRLEGLLKYPEIHTIIVTVLHEYESIRKKVLRTRPDVNVIPIVNMN